MKYNRGKTVKLSVRLSTTARQKMDQAAKNLGISSGGVMMFELTKLLEDPLSKIEIDELSDEITLEREHFVVTINEKMKEKIEALAARYDMKKNILIGYIVSNHFEKMDLGEAAEAADQKKLMIQVNENLKKKMIEYSEDNFIPLNALVSYSILEGPYDGLPVYKEGEIESMFTNVPENIGDMVKDRAEALNIREHFYTALCLYKQFMTPEGRFYEKGKGQ